MRTPVFVSECVCVCESVRSCCGGGEDAMEDALTQEFMLSVCHLTYKSDLRDTHAWLSLGLSGSLSFAPISGAR